MGADRHTAYSNSVLSHSALFGPMGALSGEIPGKPHRAAEPYGGASLQTEFFSLRRGERYRAGGRFWRDAGLIASTSVRGEVRV